MAVNQRTELRLKTALNLAQALTTDFVEGRQRGELRAANASVPASPRTPC